MYFNQIERILKKHHNNRIYKLIELLLFKEVYYDSNRYTPLRLNKRNNVKYTPMLLSIWTYI